MHPTCRWWPSHTPRRGRAHASLDAHPAPALRSPRRPDRHRLRRVALAPPLNANLWGTVTQPAGGAALRAVNLSHFLREATAALPSSVLDPTSRMTTARVPAPPTEQPLDFRTPEEQLSFSELPRPRVIATLAGVMSALLLAALDQTIVGTAMPRIVAELNGFEHYAWVTTAY